MWYLSFNGMRRSTEWCTGCVSEFLALASAKFIIIFVLLLDVYALTCMPDSFFCVLTSFKSYEVTIGTIGEIPRRHMNVLSLGQCYVKMVVVMRVICSLFLQGLSPLYTSMHCLLT